MQPLERKEMAYEDLREYMGIKYPHLKYFAVETHTETFIRTEEFQ